MPPGSTPAKPVLLVFLLALALYVAYFALDGDSIANDTRKYVLPAESLLAGHGYAREGQPETERVPGYPLMRAGLRAAGLDLRQIALLQHVLSAAAGDFDSNLERRQRELRAAADARVRREMGIDDVSTIPYVKRAASDFRLGREIVLAHPFAFAKLFVRGVAINFLGGSAEALTHITTLSRSAENRLLLAYTSLALILAIIGQLWLLQQNRPLGVLILITVGYFIAFTAGALAYSRFRVPVVPMYAIAIAAGIHVLREA